MKLLTFQTDAGLAVGMDTKRGVLDIASAAAALSSNEAIPIVMSDILEGGRQAQDHLKQLALKAEAEGDDSLFIPEEQLTWGPCVPKPGKIICVGLNYRKHAIETNSPIPQIPILFSKYNNSLSAHGQDVEIPDLTQKLDYEAELAVVIGSQAKNLSREMALDCVAGYSCANDLSARDLQLQTSQWLAGKSCDGFCPLGPYLVTSDEVEHPNSLQIRTYVNGEVRQNSNTLDMIFHVDEIISFISSLMTLEPGDVILTGTPEGVVMGYPPEMQIYLQPGDEVTIEIESLGSLTNRVKAPL